MGEIEDRSRMEERMMEHPVGDRVDNHVESGETKASRNGAVIC